MGKNAQKVVLITGASSGIGKACAEHLSKKRYRIYGTSRKRAETGSYKMINMDVTDDKSVKEAVNQIITNEHRIDVVINSAGIGIAGSIEDTSIEEAKRQFETNFFGILRVSKAVLPHMRKQNNGLLINISSGAGLVGLPFQGLYSATKYAIEGMSEALRMELKVFNISVVLIEPGDFKTNFTLNRMRIEGCKPSSPYYRQFEDTLKVIEHGENSGANPELIAKKIESIIGGKSPKIRYLIVKPEERLLLAMRTILPHRFVERIMMYHFHVR